MDRWNIILIAKVGDLRTEPMVIASGMKLLVAGAKTICRLWKNVGKNRMDTEVLRDRLDFVQTAAIDASHGSGYARTLEPTVDGISEEVGELESASNTDGVTRIGNVRLIMLADKILEDISNLNDRLDRLTSDVTMAAAVETSGAVREMSTSVSHSDCVVVLLDCVL